MTHELDATADRILDFMLATADENGDPDPGRVEHWRSMTEEERFAELDRRAQERKAGVR